MDVGLSDNMEQGKLKVNFKFLKKKIAKLATWGWCCETLRICRICPKVDAVSDIKRRHIEVAWYGLGEYNRLKHQRN